MPADLAQKLDGLPPSPGCYLFRDAGGRVLYVGKAKSLRARVRSYFQPGTSDARTFLPALLRAVADVETVIAANEKEAAILENALVKEHQPRFNVKLRDDKEFLTLRLDLRHEYPRLETVRRPEPDGARYFGPFHSATAARRTLHLVEKHFQLRTCTDRELRSRSRPCLQYQIRRCLGPCVYPVDPAQYRGQVRAVGLFIEGRHDELRRELQARMDEASRDLEFERAAMLRDQLRAVELVRERQRVEAVGAGDLDAVGLHREGQRVEVGVVHVRGGRVVDLSTHSLSGVELPDDEVVAAFLRDRYGEGGPLEAWLPPVVLLPVLPEGSAGVAEWLGERRARGLETRGERGSKSVELVVPRRGPRRRLLELAEENARHAFQEKRRAEEDRSERLVQVQRRLRLATLPRRIECLDVSHLGGQDAVGALSVLVDGTPAPSRYRSFRLRDVAPGDDYGAMAEVLARRFRRATEGGAEGTEGSDEWALPDLLVVDGGRGQLAVALAAARDVGLFELPIVGLAKERESPRGERLVERVYLPGQKNPLALRPGSAELMVLGLARDEAHRFANRGRRRTAQSRRAAGPLEAVPGVGPRTSRALLRAFGSLEAIAAASEEALAAVPGVTRRQAGVLRRHFHAGPDGAARSPDVEVEEAAPEPAAASLPGVPTEVGERQRG